MYKTLIIKDKTINELRNILDRFLHIQSNTDIHNEYIQLMYKTINELQNESKMFCNSLIGTDIYSITTYENFIYSIFVDNKKGAVIDIDDECVTMSHDLSVEKLIKFKNDKYRLYLIFENKE